MKKDIPVKKVEDVAIAIIPNDKDDQFWDVFILNLKGDDINNVLINSKGYGVRDGETVKTSQLRYFYEQIGAQMAVMIEPLPAELTQLTNEFWVSFNYDNFMYDKKYVFVRGSILETHFTDIPIVNKRGIMIR